MATLRLGASLMIRGHLAASEDLTVHGQFEGQIEVRAHTVTVGCDARIDAPIVAKSVRIEGTVHGTVTATERVEIRASGQLHGEVVCPRIVIAEGALVQGTVQTQTPDGVTLRGAGSGPVAALDGGRAHKSPAA